MATWTAADMRMHHLVIILTLTFIQGHTDHNHENNKCSIISETASNAYQVYCEDCLTKGLQSFFSLMTLLFTQGHNCVSDLSNFL